MVTLGERAGSRTPVRTRPWLKQQWCIGRLDSEYLARMEDVLNLSATPDSDEEPTIGVDEKLV